MEETLQHTLDIYQLTSHFPNEERFGLTSQIRQASISIAANIAEGCVRDSNSEMLLLMRIAMGFSSELDYKLLLAHDWNYLGDQDFYYIQEELVIIRKMLNAFIQKLKLIR